MSEARQRLGQIIGGSLLEGLEMKLDPGLSPEELRAGQYVVVDGLAHRFYTMITDVRLASTSSEISVRPPAAEDDLLRGVLADEWIYITLHLRPLLQLPLSELGTGADLDNAQVKTVPAHFVGAWRASDQDVARVFGDPAARGRFHVGQPLDMDTPVCLDLRRFVERSNGIFGKTGTGKTFLTRLVLAGLQQKMKGEVVTLTFDMHNEYACGSRHEGSEQRVKGLCDLFPGGFAVYTLDEKSSDRRGARYDAAVKLSYADLEPGDIIAMADELGLSEAGCDTLALLRDFYDQRWLHQLLDGDLEAVAAETGAHAAALGAARRKLARVARLPFLQRTKPADQIGAAETLAARMADQRQSAILEYGGMTSLLGYLLVANVLTRQIHARWVERSERYHATGDAAARPPHLLICVEEAHKFLNATAARQTSFGQIARELRKYFVSLLVVDQRPSGIDDEILSQLGTRITAQLNDDRDIAAVLAGASGASSLRAVLAGLDSKQQALIFGHAVPMPVVLRTRTWDEEFYRGVKGVREDVDSTMTAMDSSAWPKD